MSCWTCVLSRRRYNDQNHVINQFLKQIQCGHTFSFCSIMSLRIVACVSSSYSSMLCVESTYRTWYRVNIIILVLDIGWILKSDLSGVDFRVSDNGRFPPCLPRFLQRENKLRTIFTPRRYCPHAFWPAYWIFKTAFQYCGTIYRYINCFRFYGALNVSFSYSWKNKWNVIIGYATDTDSMYHHPDQYI